MCIFSKWGRVFVLSSPLSWSHQKAENVSAMENGPTDACHGNENEQARKHNPIDPFSVLELHNPSIDLWFMY